VYSNAQRSYASTVCVNHSDCCSGVDVEEAAVTQSSGEGHRAEKCSVLRGSRIAAAAAMQDAVYVGFCYVGFVDLTANHTLALAWWTTAAG